jgi:hypothetical protein
MKNLFARWEKMKACRFHISDLSGSNRMHLPASPVPSCFPIALLDLDRVFAASFGLFHDLQSKRDDLRQKYVV